MKKFWFRTGCTLLAALMLTASLASCKKKNNDPDEGTQKTTVATSEGEKGANLPDVDYNNYNFVVLVRNNDQAAGDVWVESTTEDDVVTSVWMRNQYLKDTFNVTLSVKRSTMSNDDTTALKDIQSNACDYDLIATHGRSAMDYAVNNCGYNWYNLPYVDLSADWWCRGAVDSWTVDGRVFCMVGDLSYMNVGQAMCMYFNKKILSDNNIEYPYQLAIDDKWTLEQMKKIALDCYNGMDNKTGTFSLADDSFAHVTGGWRGPMQMLYSTGYKIVEGNKVGEFRLGVYNQITQNAYEEYLDNFLGTSACDASDAGYDTMQKAFKENRVVFYDDLLEDSKEFDGVDFGIMPWPKSDENVYDYPTMVNAFSNSFVVPITTTNAERTSVILEAMAYYGYKNTIPTYFDQVLSYKYSPDSQSTQMLQMIRQALVYDLGYYYVVGEVSNLGRTMYLMKSARSMSALYQSDAKAALNKLNTNWGNIKVS